MATGSAPGRPERRRRWPWVGQLAGRWQINAEPAHLRRTSPIGVFVQGDSPEGLTDLAGNLWQWTASVYTERLEASALTTVAPEGLARRVVRGGSWHSTTVACLPSFRDRASPDDRNRYLGFRLVSN